MRKIILLHIILLFSVLAWSQNPATAYPYECSFEEGDTTLGAWVLNPNTPTAVDQWIIGTAVHSEGRRALYISSDGQNDVMGKTANVTVAYLRYKFPEVGKYDVSFDWKGIGDSVSSKLYVICCLESDFLNNTSNTNYCDINKIVSSTSGVLSQNVIDKACQYLGESGEKFVCGSAAWQNVSFAQQVSVGARNVDKVFVFVFIWMSSYSADTPKSSIAIDNFQVNSAGISKPTDLIVYPHCEDSSLIVTWKAESAYQYDIHYRKVGESNWREQNGISEGPSGYTRNLDGSYTYSLKKILEGSYDVRIRGRYYDPEEQKELRTNFVYQTNILVYCPENHCINYVDLYGPNVVCTYGMHEKHTGQTPYDNIGVVDYGPDSQDSRHTLHVDPTEVDPRTDSMLHTVPPGAMASVRLGNWNASGKAQSITYNMTVDTATQGILIMKYAVVLDNSGHDRDEEPYFRIEILDSIGQSIDARCGAADFAYSDAVKAGDTKGWHLTTYQGGELAWKEWTSVGVPLMDYDGQNIQVRITSADCGQTVHFGYGYFTLDCANAHIETENCGADASLTCVAPDGFAYEWRDENDSIWSNNRIFEVDAGLHTYTCKVSFVEEPECYFEISTVSAPRFPVPEYTYENVLANCMSTLEFTNTSHVMNKFEGYENHTTELCNEGRWVFRSLTTNQPPAVSTYWNPTYICRDEGDTIEITYTTYIGANNACDSTRVDTVIVPSIYSEPTEFHYTTCSESPIKFDDKWFNTDTVYQAKFKNRAGCDSVSTLFLKVYPQPKDVIIHDSICSDQSLTVAGVKYTQPLDNYLIMLKTKNGCDSAVYLTLTVNERIKAKVDTLSFICADDEQLYLTFDIAAGQYDSLGIKFNTPTLRDTMIYTPGLSQVMIPYPDTITPAVYQAEITFYQFCCGPYTQVRDIEIRYRSSIVEQKWNDVLTLLSPQYNGGYEFMGIQWYKDNMPIEGETHSYLYQPLDVNSIYYVELTRPDGTKMSTCPIQPVYHEQQTPYPTIVQAGQHMPIYMEQAATIWYYTISGQLYSTFTLPQGYASLPTPGQAGVYIIRSVSANGESQAQVMIAE